MMTNAELDELRARCKYEAEARHFFPSDTKSWENCLDKESWLTPARLMRELDESVGIVALTSDEFARDTIPDWLPIEEARDYLAASGEKEILGCCAYGEVRIWRWNDERHNKNPRPFWESDPANKTRDRANQPTHWMPLPQPPMMP